jgi:uncharacterized protein with GYD domain
MAKYLYQASYSVEGTKGVLKAGASARRTAVTQMVEGLGGKVDAFYFAFGSDDVVILFDMPDHIDMAAACLAAAASGALSQTRTTVLLSVEDIDAAAKKQIVYRAPGT